MPASLPVSVGDEVDADLLNEISGALECAAYYLNTSISTLTSTANTMASIVSGSFTFVSGYAYRIDMTTRWTVTGGSPSGTSARTCIFGLRRATAAGTAIYNSGRNEGVSSSGAGGSTSGIHWSGQTYVKCTAGDTTQTIHFTGQFDNAAPAAVATSMGISVNGSVTPTYFSITRIGLAANFPDAFEVPTS